MEKEIEIPFGAKDSELKGWEYTIPEGMMAEIKDGKIIVKEKESEDEMIRKAIIEILNRLPACYWHGQKEKDDCLAYLEKQKEQKPIDIVFVSDWLREHIKTYVNSEYNEFHKTVEYDGSVNVEKLIQDLKKAAEQKPADDSEVLARHITNDSLSGEVTSRLAKCGWYVSENKPAEWSEEDKYILEDAITAIDMHLTDEFKEVHPNLFNAFLVAKDFLKSLRPQPKAELDVIAEKESYKDGFFTARRNLANAFMQYLDENRPEGKMCLSNGECKDINKAFEVGDWEKILRYANKFQFHWKPSEEQPETSNNLVDIDTVREDFIAEVYRVLDADSTNDRANAIIDAFDSLPTVSQVRPEVDLEKFDKEIKSFKARYKHPEIVSIKGAMAFMARMFYQYPNVARLWYENLPKTTMDCRKK